MEISPDVRRVQLHLGKCIEDLDELHKVPDLKSKRATGLCKSAQKLLEKAEEYREKGDEELSYVFYMRYLRVVAYLGHDKEYLKDKTYYTNMLGAKNPKKAMDAAEKLKNSLISRYKSEQKRRHVEPTADSVKKTVEAPAPAPAPLMPAIVDSLPGLDDVTIKCEQLYPLLKGGKLRVMVLDARPGKDFLESHINYPACISVPEECIYPGLSANVLEQNLPLPSKKVWAERATMELIVMLDWSSASVIPAKTLYLLKTILLKWDIKVQYAREPLALLGGYEDWLLKYPACTTNPQVTPPSQNSFMEDMLGGIDYPNWSDLSPTTPRPALPGEPIVDRSSKAAAVQVYEERARNMQLILDQQERLADTSLKLEEERLEAEQDWRRVRNQSEVEHREEMRAKYQLREQEISSQLMQLESKQYDMELENKQLRERLEEYQRREREEELRRAAPQQEKERERILQEQMSAARDLAAKRARIAQVTEQRDELDRQRELMEHERKRKLAEARDKKKPDLDKDEDGDTYMASPGDGPNMNRSRSYPNMKAAEEEEPPTPVFDRSTKPATRALRDARDFEPVWGEVGRGLTGLKNLGNTCYMSSIVQCLSNTTVLVKYFCSGQYLEHVNRDNATHGAVADELAALVSALWSGQYRYVASRLLQRELGKHMRQFRESQQQDSHEFLTILMDWLHLDLQVAIEPPQQAHLTPPERAWLDYTESKESLILRLFYGQIRSTVKCTVCNTKSVTYETFSNLSLELPANSSRCSLSDCLKLYLNGEMVPGWNCPGCKEKREAVKKLDISRLPPILVVHFKRFYAEAIDLQLPSQMMPYKKKKTLIDFPLSDLDMRQFALNCSDNYMYDLYAVSNHYGSMDCGHYTAMCKNYFYNKWYKYDDHQVSETLPSEVKSSAAYILFYACSKTSKAL